MDSRTAQWIAKDALKELLAQDLKRKAPHSSERI